MVSPAGSHSFNATEIILIFTFASALITANVYETPGCKKPEVTELEYYALIMHKIKDMF